MVTPATYSFLFAQMTNPAKSNMSAKTSISPILFRRLRYLLLRRRSSSEAVSLLRCAVAASPVLLDVPDMFSCSDDGPMPLSQSESRGVLTTWYLTAVASEVSDRSDVDVGCGVMERGWFEAGAAVVLGSPCISVWCRPLPHNRPPYLFHNNRRVL